jgi:hypothetical protein
LLRSADLKQSSFFTTFKKREELPSIFLTVEGAQAIVVAAKTISKNMKISSAAHPPQAPKARRIRAKGEAGKEEDYIEV